MPDNCIIDNGDERNREIPGFPQRIDDVLLGVTCMRRMQKCGDDNSLNGRNVVFQFVSDF